MYGQDLNANLGSFQATETGVKGAIATEKAMRRYQRGKMV